MRVRCLPDEGLAGRGGREIKKRITLRASTYTSRTYVTWKVSAARLALANISLVDNQRLFAIKARLKKMGDGHSAI